MVVDASGWHGVIPNDSRSFRPDPRPAKRHKASAAEWETLREQKQPQRCRLRDETCVRVLTLHHIVPRSLGGSDVLPNLVWLCGTGTTGHHGLVEAHDPKACSDLRDSLKPDELGYAITTKSAEFISRRYPRRTEAA